MVPGRIGPEQRVEVPESLRDAGSVAWGENPYRGFVIVSAESDGLDDEGIDFEGVTELVDGGRSVRPPVDVRDRFGDGGHVFWVANEREPFWYVLSEEDLLYLLNG